MDTMASSELIHSELGFDKLHIRWEKHVAINMFKVDNNMVPEPVTQLFDKLDENQRYTTRSVSKENYQLPKK